ncbi:hypothetical protein [Sandarakinorhabdus limnophila]|uniref:hypothetical protein n=1 Tax=Sandarakinorhabdus limnophila TaxID=210512 RepID=UPI0026EA0943|nr:hypothetical protein [Sandarakinorhabdus limnophila]MCM0032774.1 hypothetical protein [Sandarakinorhabdus limnophila]
MVRLFDFLTGGNIKIAALKVKDRYKANNYSYRKAFEELNFEAFSNIMRSKNPSSANLIGTYHIKNFTYLVALDLNLYAAPRGTSYWQTLEDFSDKIQYYLRQSGVPEIWISGDRNSFDGEGP